MFIDRLLPGSDLAADDEAIGEPPAEAHVVVGVEVREEVLRDPGDGAVPEGVHDEWCVGDALVERAGPLGFAICKTLLTNKLLNIA